MGKGKLLFIFLKVLVIGVGFGQELRFNPDVVLGNRSITYKHLVKYSVNQKLTVDNLTLFDTEYNTDENNLFFIRNTISYSVFKNVSANAAIGIKNPGAFGTVSMSYLFRSPNFLGVYTMGVTYQKGGSLEQSLVMSYTPFLWKGHRGYLNLLATANLNSNEYTRGLQQVKVGIQKKLLTTGIAVNLDQFNNAKRTLTNFGIFFKYNF
ncbi:MULTISPECIES: hypothetical protein [unclassified Allomuricauda]|uniref:hypothetical protein n=1 Tax=unclassified Allomuricauda TaxID=2615049 RepID=UPI00274017E2|nr:MULTISPECIES: hypothetical protein [unclassified Allomuricauda]